jgi:membrane protease YdiL (CAAX protease family)
MPMSFREKLSWIALAAMLIAYGWYFWNVVPALKAGASAPLHYGPLLIGTIIAVIVLSLVPTIVISAFSPAEAKAPEDEREKLFSARGTQWGYVVLVTGALYACVAGLFLGASSEVVANEILMAIVVSHLVKYAVQITYFRAGA